MVLGGNRKLLKKNYQKFHHYGNDMELLVKFYTMSHSHYHHLVPLTKQTISVFIEFFIDKYCRMRLIVYLYVWCRCKFYKQTKPIEVLNIFMGLNFSLNFS